MTEERNPQGLICLQAHSGIYNAEIKVAATCNKNEQQQMPKVMLNKGQWTKTTWKSFEEIVRRGRNRSI
jgi:hypothetical protein